MECPRLFVRGATCTSPFDLSRAIANSLAPHSPQPDVSVSCLAMWEENPRCDRIKTTCLAYIWFVRLSRRPVKDGRRLSHTRS